MIQNVASVGVQNNANLVAQKKAYKTKSNIMALGAGASAVGLVPVSKNIGKIKNALEVANPINPDILMKSLKKYKIAKYSLLALGGVFAIGSLLNRSKANKIQEQ